MRHFSDSQQGLLLLGPSGSVGTSEFDKGQAVIKRGRPWADCEAWPPLWGKKGRGAILLAGRGEEEQEGRCLRSCGRKRLEIARDQECKQHRIIEKNKDRK